MKELMVRFYELNPDYGKEFYQKNKEKLCERFDLDPTNGYIPGKRPTLNAKQAKPKPLRICPICDGDIPANAEVCPHC